MYRKFIYPAVVVILLAQGSCSVGIDRTMLIIHGAIPITQETACEVAAPGDSSGYLPSGIVELGAGQTGFEYDVGLHMTYPFSDVALNATPAFPNYNKATTANNISLREVEYLVESEADLNTRLQSDTEFDWDTITETQEPSFVAVPFTSLTSAGIFVGKVTVPLEGLTAAPIVGDKTPIMLHLVIRGVTLDGDAIESSVLHFPMEICNGCLSNPVCPPGTEQAPAPLLPCNVGQDEPLVECVLPAAAGG